MNEKESVRKSKKQNKKQNKRRKRTFQNKQVMKHNLILHNNLIQFDLFLMKELNNFQINFFFLINSKKTKLKINKKEYR